ncbi:MAG: DUF308 domain-containing protein [Paludibacteraceae bacterium]|nr:DUF308 domain-containing protein [Paludibacteraceae bacterium]
MKNSSKMWMCLGGLALVVLGVLCIANPDDALISLSWAFGLTLVIAGCGTFGTWATLRAVNPYSGMTFLAALLQVFLGVAIIVNPLPLAVSLPLVFAFWVFYEGLNLLLDSLNYKKLGFSKWWVLCLLGALVLIAGIYSFFFNPAASAKTIAWFIGLGIIADGIGNWVKIAAYNKIEKKLTKVADRLHQLFDIEDADAEEVR